MFYNAITVYTVLNFKLTSTELLSSNCKIKPFIPVQCNVRTLHLRSQLRHSFFRRCQQLRHNRQFLGAN